MQEKFEYKYVAPTEQEKKEVSAIRAQYIEEKEDDKLARLKKLDKKVKEPPKVWGLVLGIVGTLIFGGGLSLILEFSQMLWGTLICVLGLIPIGLAYPIYQWVLESGKAQHWEEILRLSNEILEEEQEKDEFTNL